MRVNETNGSPEKIVYRLRPKFRLHNTASDFHQIHCDSAFLNFEACGFYRPVFTWRVGGSVEETTEDFIQNM